MFKNFFIISKKQPISVIKQLVEKKSRCEIIDVRRNEEYRSGYIFGTVNIPLEQLESEIIKRNTPKDYPIYVLCSYGQRSKKAYAKLCAMGYMNVVDLGGIVKWPYELER